MVALASLGTICSAMADMTMRGYQDGGLVGNGGGTVVCRGKDQKILSSQLLDYYEASTHPALTVDAQTIPGDWKAKVKALIERVHAKSELRYKLYSTWFSTFEAESEKLDKVQFSTVPDSQYIAVPEGCAFEQAVIQSRPIFSGDRRYFINDEIWEALDDTNKAGLVMHELVYREALAYGHTDSIRARHLNLLYGSSQFGNMSLGDYAKTLVEARYELVDTPAPTPIQSMAMAEFNPARLWQAGPDDKLEKSYFFKGRAIAQLGKCAGDGCNGYQAYPENTYNVNGLSNFRLAEDLISFTVGNDLVISVEGRVLSNTMVSLVDPTGTGNVQLAFSTIQKNDANGFWYLHAKKWASAFTQGVNFNLDPQQGLLLTSVEAKSLYALPVDGVTTVNTALFNVYDACHYGRVNFETDQKPSVIYFVTVNTSECEQGQEMESVSSVYSNGTAGAMVESNQGLGLDRVHPLRVRNSLPLWSIWQPTLQGKSVYCTSAGPVGRVNCLLPLIDGNGVVQSFTVQGNASILFFSKDSEGHQTVQAAPLQKDTNLTLHDNGMPADGIIGGDCSIVLADGTRIAAHSGQHILMNDNGDIIQIH